jgi:uridine kinase
LLIEHLRQLRAGHAVEVPRYDFSGHVRLPETAQLAPCPLVLVEGILVLAEPRLRELFDLKIFVDTDADLRLFRRLSRDIEERGRSFESVREQYFGSVRPMHQLFVEPSKRWADVIVPEGGDNRAAVELIVGKVHSVLAGA